MIKRLTPRALLVVLTTSIILSTSFRGYSQSKKASKTPPKSSISRVDKAQLEIDSLNGQIDNLRILLFKTDSMYKSERLTSADLRDQIIKLDDYRLKLEKNNDNFKGENLKLNQSNRILIIFNSLVAILLVVTLVFFLKRLTRKKPVTSDSAVVEKVNEEPLSATRFASFEDRLIQLERLGKLREKGLLSEDEFMSEKHKILGK